MADHKNLTFFFFPVSFLVVHAVQPFWPWLRSGRNFEVTSTGTQAELQHHIFSVNNQHLWSIRDHEALGTLLLNK